MALQGDIRINGIRIGYWNCRRLGCNQHVDGGDVGVCPAIHDYECYVEWYDRDTYQHRRTFMVAHRYSEGAVALAAKILDVATKFAAVPE